MIEPPFLSYKRTDHELADRLDDALRQVGVGPWRDVRSLGLGDPVRRTIRTAIRTKAGGFLWLATPQSLQSETITRLEVPQALRRSRREPNFPFVPLFSELNPGDSDLDLALGRWPWRRSLAKRARNSNGIVRAEGQCDDDFAWEAATRYQAAAIRKLTHSRASISLQFLSSKAPSQHADLVLDWRDLLVDGWPTSQMALNRVLLATRAVRRGLQDALPNGGVQIAADLRLPLAALVGWELSSARLQDVSVVQGPNVEVFASEDVVPAHDLPSVVRSELGGAGPNVVAVSTVTDLAASALRYAQSVDAASLTTLHVSTRLEPATLAGLAAQTRRLLVALNQQGRPKHLLMLGPSSFAFWLGRTLTGSGETVVPFWDQADGYDGYVVVGGDGSALHAARSHG